MTKLSFRPRTRRTAFLAVGAGLVAAGAVALVLVYFVLFPTSSPRRFALTTKSAAAGTPVAGGTGIVGTWRVATGSQAGYRVREKLAFLPAESDAVGRTSAISGSATLAGRAVALTVRAATFTVDLTKLTSDSSMRDARIRTIGVASDRYPTATFKLTAPIELPAGAGSGRAVRAPATGVLTLHGTSKTVTVPLELRLSTGGLEAIGSITFPWSQFGMTAPSVGGFVSVTDRATMEFDLHLART